jgi:hypothetical protein
MAHREPPILRRAMRRTLRRPAERGVAPGTARIRVPIVPVERNDPAAMVNRASMKTTSTNRRMRTSDMNGAPAGPSAAALGCTNTTTTNKEPTQMTPVTMCTTLRMTIDASAASIVPPLSSAASLLRIGSSRVKDAISATRERTSQLGLSSSAIPLPRLRIRPAFVPRTTRRRQETAGSAGASNPLVTRQIRVSGQIAR